MNKRDKWEMHCRGGKTFKTFSLVLFFWMRIVMSKFLVYNVSINYLQSTQNILSTKNLDWYISIKYLVPNRPNSHFPYYFLVVNKRIPKLISVIPKYLDCETIHATGKAFAGSKSLRGLCWLQAAKQTDKTGKGKWTI